MEMNQEKEQKLLRMLKRCEFVIIGSIGDTCTLTQVAALSEISTGDGEIEFAFVIGKRLGENIAIVLPHGSLKQMVEDNKHRIMQIKEFHVAVKEDGLFLNATFEREEK